MAVRNTMVWFAASMLWAATLAGGIGAQERAPEAKHWYRGNTHTHTKNSDGDSAPDVVARWYREHGYQFLFITDHEYATDVGPLNAVIGARDKFLVLPGQEITQSSDDPTRRASRFNDVFGAPAHVNALFTQEVIWPIAKPDCAVPICGAPANVPVGETITTNVKAVQAAGGIAQINHPNGAWSLVPEDLARIPDGALIEIWTPDPNVLGGGDAKGNVRPSTEAFWDWMLTRGKIAWGVAADDSHTFNVKMLEELQREFPARVAPGLGWIVVRAARLTRDDIKSAMANGEFYSSTGVMLADIQSDDTSLTITVRPPTMTRGAHMQAPRYTTRFVGRDGAVIATVAGVTTTYRSKPGESYVRAVITESTGRQAWTQPVFWDERRERSPYRAPRK